MRALVAPSTRLLRHEGKYFAHRAGLGASFWHRYLAAFDDVTLLASVRQVDEARPPSHRVDLDGISVLELSGSNPVFAAAKAGRLTRRWLDENQGALFVRSPALAGEVAAMATRRGFPFAVEMVGDPFAVARSLQSTSPAKSLALSMTGLLTRTQVKRAASVAYVSRSSLEHRYKAPRAVQIREYSSIELSAEWLAPAMPRTRNAAGPPRLVTVGSMDQPYKGVADVLEAVRLLRSHSVPVHLTVVGGGRLKDKLVAKASAMGLSPHVRFTGELGAAQVRAELDCADVFVLASWTEGLPRALIEAMARGLPCIATDVGGIPDLLSQEVLVPPHAPAQIAKTAEHLLSNPNRSVHLGTANAEIALRYRSEVVTAVRNDFYCQHRELTAQFWRRWS